MAVIVNSLHLNRLIRQAKDMAEPKGLFTAERFVIAVIDLLNLGEPHDEVMNLFFLKDWIREAHSDVDTVREQLWRYIHTKESCSFEARHYIQQRVTEAEDEVKKQGASLLSSNYLLRSILETPSDALKKALAAPVQPEKKEESDNRQITEELLEAIAREWRLSKELSARSEEGTRIPGAEPGQGQAPTADAPAEAPAGKAAESPAAGTPTAPGEHPKRQVEMLTDRVKEMQAELLSAVYGQDNAVSTFVTGYFRSEMLSLTDKARVRPRATFLFAGSPGVGKTFLAENAARVLGLPFMRFDMSEYSDKEANLEFCGSDQVYKGSKAGNVTGFVSDHPHCVLLFDEIEKAHVCVIHLLLQVLDAGRLRDNYTDKEVSFTDAILIFTTNAGKQLYENSDTGDFSHLSRKVVLSALRRDINPVTGAPFFPAAICSRFASGHVVMFNHITAGGLRDIAKREILRHADNFTKEIGIDVQIDEEVYTALLFAEGGAADARMIRSRAEAFFDDELFELFRLMASDDHRFSIGQLDSIRIRVALPENDPEISHLFGRREPDAVLVFASPEVAARCQAQADHGRILSAKTLAEGKELLVRSDVTAILVDYSYGQVPGQDCLNVEDVGSLSRDFLGTVLEEHRDIPVYLLETKDMSFSAEERVSFLRQGIRDILPLDGEEGAFSRMLEEICYQIHQQQSMNALARSNRVVNFHTSQTLFDGGTRAEIRLYDFSVSVAVEAEDSENILSRVSKPQIGFDRVIGAEEAKGELKYFVEYLKNPRHFLATGVQPPKGVLLYGPPGTGKTLLAKAMAYESDVTFISAEGNQFLKKYVGEGPEKIHELFRTARKYAPSIVFIDEIDAIAKERQGGDRGIGEETLTALLTEMDGFKSDGSKPVFVLAATNFDAEPGSAKSLDPALMRRFDRRVYIDLPNKAERMKYLQLKSGDPKTFCISGEKLENLAMRSAGMSLAELESVLELALRTSIRSGSSQVNDEILEEAFETFNSGEKKSWDISQLERVARHEAGHAFLCWSSGETPSYLTVVARSNHGGYMQHADNEGKAIYTREELRARIRTSLGGRAAEVVFYGREAGLSTGAGGDLVSATALAKQMVCSYGMSDDLGLAVWGGEALTEQARQAVNRILQEEMEAAIRILEENRSLVDALAQRVMTQNHMSGVEIEALLSSYPKK